MATVKIKPELYDLSERADERFNYKLRKCVAPGEISLNVSRLGISEYTQVNCLISAMWNERKLNCKVDNLTCINSFSNQLGRWKEDKGSGKICLPSCKGQQNKLDINFVKFPNDEIQNSREFVKIVKKLFWSCSPNITRFGYKRRRLDNTYPKLCPFYDEFFYQNDDISTQFQKEEQKIVSFWKQLSANKEIEFIDEDGITTMGQVLVATEMSTQNVTQFTQEILNYCKENLAKVEAFIPSPFVSKYLLNEEMSPESFISNIGGLMGLCMGLSFVSLAEVGIFIANCLWSKTAFLLSK